MRFAPVRCARLDRERHELRHQPAHEQDARKERETRDPQRQHRRGDLVGEPGLEHGRELPGDPDAHDPAQEGEHLGEKTPIDADER
jgi:hypothetical protein